MLRDEAGGAMVASAIGGARMSAVNLAVVVSHFIHAGMPPGEVDAMLAPLPVTVVDANAALARIAGHLRKVTAEAGLSLGDRFASLSQRGTSFRPGPPIASGAGSRAESMPRSLLSGETRRLSPACNRATGQARPDRFVSSTHYPMLRRHRVILKIVFRLGEPQAMLGVSF